MSKANLLELFKYNKFKLRIIEEQIAERGTVYRCGTLIDLCTGPHVKDSGAIKVLKILNVSKQKKFCQKRCFQFNVHLVSE